MISKLFRQIFGFTYITRKNPKPFNEVHAPGCRYGQAILKKRYLSKKQAYNIIKNDEGKKHYDGCRFCMPHMNTQEVR